MALRFLILGPFEVHAEGASLALGGRQQRALLATLALRANELVSSERLIDELWPEDPPDTADHLVHVYVSRLRKALGAEGREILITRAPGYELLIERGQLDLHRFEDLTASARQATEAERFSEASTDLRDALALWRGPALSDLVSESFARADAERLNELRISAIEDLMSVELAAGRDDLIPELKSLVTQHPLRERLHGFLIVALYREGRQAEALAAYEATRTILRDELGIDPSQDLQALHRRVLSQDPTLDASLHDRARPQQASTTAPRDQHQRRNRKIFGAIAVALAAWVAILIVGERSTGPVSTGDRSVLAFVADAKSAPTNRMAFGGSGSAIAADGNSLWVADGKAGTVTRIDIGSEVADTPVSSIVEPVSITAGDGRAWVIDPFAGRITALNERGGIDTAFTFRSAAPVDATYVQGSLWVVDAACECVFRLDASTGRTTERISTPFQGAGPIRIDSTSGAIWVLGSISRSLIEIAPSSGDVIGEPVALSAQPTDLAVSTASIWVSMEGIDLVEKLSASGTPQSDVAVPGGPSSIVADQSGAWVVTARGGRLYRLTGTTAMNVQLGSRPEAIAIGDAGAWVSLGTR